MRTDKLSELYEHTGPFASVFVDVGNDGEDGAEEREVRVGDSGRALSRQRGLRTRGYPGRHVGGPS